MYVFRYDLFCEGKLRAKAYTRKKLLGGVKNGRGFLNNPKYDCVEIYCNGKWIKEYSN